MIMGTKQGLDRQELHKNLRHLTFHNENENKNENETINKNLEDLLYSQLGKNENENESAQTIYDMYKSLSKNPIDYIGNIEEQIDNLLKYTRSFI